MSHKFPGGTVGPQATLWEPLISSIFPSDKDTFYYLGCFFLNTPWKTLDIIRATDTYIAHLSLIKPCEVYTLLLSPFWDGENLNSKWEEPALEPRQPGFRLLIVAWHWLLKKGLTEIDPPKYMVLIKGKKNNWEDSKGLSICSEEQRAVGCLGWGCSGPDLQRPHCHCLRQNETFLPQRAEQMIGNNLDVLTKGTYKVNI